MINTESFINELIEYGFDEFIGVPCSFLKPVINHLTNLQKYIAAANEGDAVAYAAGAYIAGKKVAVLMQNSGLSNALSPLTSLTAVFKIPVFMLIGNRGGYNDEPQHKLIGRITGGILKLIETDWKLVTEAADIKRDIENIYLNKKSLAYLVGKGDFTDVALIEKSESEYISLTRNDVLNVVDSIRDDNTIVVTTTGFISREMYDKFRNDKNFYMVGSMGCAISIGIGIANYKSDMKVIVIDGDGSFLMRPSGALLQYETFTKNIIHIIIDNGLYESTGGQRAVSGKINISDIVSSIYGAEYFNETSEKKEVKNILEKYMDNITNCLRAQSLICKVSKVNDNKLGRPDPSFEKYLKKFIQSI